MRQVRFTLYDRLVLIPVELVYVLFPWLLLALLFQFWPAVAALLAGVVLFPLLLPWLPGHNFSPKGWILGGLVTLPFAIQSLANGPALSWLNLTWVVGILLAMPALTAFLALNFTGSTTFTSRSGVRAEMFRYIPAMVWSFAIGLLMIIGSLVIKIGGWHV